MLELEPQLEPARAGANTDQQRLRIRTSNLSNLGINLSIKRNVQAAVRMRAGAGTADGAGGALPSGLLRGDRQQ